VCKRHILNWLIKNNLLTSQSIYNYLPHFDIFKNRPKFPVGFNRLFDFKNKEEFIEVKQFNSILYKPNEYQIIDDPYDYLTSLLTTIDNTNKTNL
jgi:hypothetical protein